MYRYFLAIFSLLCAGLAIATGSVSAAGRANTRAIDFYREDIELEGQPARTLVYHTGTVELASGVATLAVPEGFKYLEPADAKFVMEDLFENDPAETLGLLVPRELLLTKGETEREYYIDLTWNPDGYVSDADASKLDYDDILKTLQDQARERNAQSDVRSKGDILGWAEAPSYDSARKVLYFAKNIHFYGNSGSTLNYNMQFLGRRGYLQLNLVSSIETLDVVKKDFPTLLGAVKFEPGNRYEDYDPTTDEAAAYGLAGLLGVAGAATIAKNTGILLILAKFGKLIFIAIAGVLYRFRDTVLGFFRRKRAETAPLSAESTLPTPEQPAVAPTVTPADPSRLSFETPTTEPTLPLVTPVDRSGADPTPKNPA